MTAKKDDKSQDQSAKGGEHRQGDEFDQEQAPPGQQAAGGQDPSKGQGEQERNP